MATDENPNQPRQFREHFDVWEAFDPIAKRVTGINTKGARAAYLNQLIRDAFAEHGTPEERAIVARADAEMEERKKNRGRKLGESNRKTAEG
ncbi:hypothetical protein Q8791_23090 [Nocardiopsis sp. CT-R113]|uniref:Centromere-binding protein ParB C-terminal domain-containing protein n=1 Tax=Nocardiopsis codii TaxID=3065942 RepID=A0ABU7KET6_9ACTN|nr:hypothetical protein [Nocardiopsis sp. CT-R113]MEE2040107.1 hypothetical protein [Nocardiopsis sp. CT-R113]